ncbi:probable RNA-binding protein 19 [Parasteatoda tepidariorum]|uniref:probable RNA-binding protein 19 n=1 Tax=Parasteatoda tepidariorum TaxID=114398 RepID=UPI0039BD8403
MSRIVVKNLPKDINAKKLEEVFSANGEITDLQLKYNKQGIFRQFAFIGYKTEEEATNAKKIFHNTFFHTSKIQVEICSNLGDANKPKSWKESLEFKKSKEKEQTKDVNVKSLKKNDFVPDELKNDPQFKEYLGVNQDRKSKPVWGEDVDLSSSDSESSQEDSEEEDNTAQKLSLECRQKISLISFLECWQLKNDPQFKEYLGVNQDRKSKPVWGEDVDLSSSDSESSQEDSEEEDNSDHSNADKKQSQEEQQSISEERKEDQKDYLKSTTGKQKKYKELFTVKLTNLPYQCKKAQIKKFFNSLKIASLRLPPKRKGFAFVGFKTEKDMKQALIKNKGFLDGRCIQVLKYIQKCESDGKPKQSEKYPDKELNEELLAETGRIYIRNLCYTVTEADIEQLFVKYGPIAELHVPIDFNTRKSKGFAFVTFMFAEHAVKAFSELDGTIFQGRLLHLIPARAKKEFESNENDTNFKKRKEAERKKESGSSHNWNILFLGMNAVADAIAEKYKIEKSQLLSGDSKNKKSVAVQMALAETEIVEKTRTFLVENGVQLDAFSQPTAQRSKTVIVVKHLPAKTTAAELHELFSSHGSIKRVLLPPTGGMVALVEFENPSEAKTAFTKLAYRKFHYLPLFLEWAPINSLKDPPLIKKEDVEKKESADSTEDSTDIPLSEGTTIYVKNINFSTTQENLEKHFKQCGPIYSATISTKKDPKTGKLFSMGFGFVQFLKKESAVFALQNLQQSILDGHPLELKFANRSITSTQAVKRKKYEVKEQTSSKILVRNVPFQASVGEVRALFKEFGTLKIVRLPKKLGKANEHRGFGFVEYQHAEDAKRAFDALCHSTHLFNRRLVLEWANPDTDNVSELREKTANQYFESEPMKKVKKGRLKEDVVMAAARNESLDSE